VAIHRTNTGTNPVDRAILWYCQEQATRLQICCMDCKGMLCPLPTPPRQWALRPLSQLLFRALLELCCTVYCVVDRKSLLVHPKLVRQGLVEKVRSHPVARILEIMLDSLREILLADAKTMPPHPNDSTTTALTSYSGLSTPIEMVQVPADYGP
jgi:hypothetical protein